MAHHRITRDGLTIVITDICFRCGHEQAGPSEIEPGDAFKCVHCGGWSEVLSRFSDDGATVCTWFSPFDRKEPAPAKTP